MTSQLFSNNLYRFSVINFHYIYSTAAQTEVLSLQQICIDCVAETLHSPRCVHFLPLPNNIKRKIAKVVFDKDVDFCYDYFHKYERLSSDTVIDSTVYKNLISTVR